MPAVVCPLCGIRRARRSCPAVGQQICAICCGTKRLTEIACPSDCPWLASAREHPAAAVVRQQQRDVGLLMDMVRDFDQRQSQLFLMVCTFLKKYPTAELQPLVDDDVADAMAALASTYETASRGLIYEHRPASLPAERIVNMLRPLLTEAGEGGSAFERDAAVVLRRAEHAVHDVRAADPGNRRAFIDFLMRVVVRRPPAEEAAAAGEPAGEPPRLIIP